MKLALLTFLLVLTGAVASAQQSVTVSATSPIDATCNAGQPQFGTYLGVTWSCQGGFIVPSAGVLNALSFGVKADGTNQSANFQSAISAITAKGGGSLFIPYSPNCYVVSAAVKVGSNTTVFSDARTTCVQKMAGTQATCTDPGCNSVFYTDSLSAVANVHFIGFTVDGNKANITGVTGDGGYFGILLEDCTNCSVESMLVKNAYTGGVTVACGEAPVANVGDNVTILNTVITASRRNNLEAICGTNTKMFGGELSFATGGSLSVGVDVEADLAGQLLTGFQLSGVNVHHNRDGGILIQPAYDTAPNFNVINCSSHDNGILYGGLKAVNFNVVAASNLGYMSISGGRYSNNGASASAAVTIIGFKFFSLDGGAVLSDSQRGLLISSNVTTSVLGPSTLSGTVYDLSVDGPNSLGIMAGAKLEHGIVQPADIGNVIFPMTQAGTTGAVTGSASSYSFGQDVLIPGQKSTTGARYVCIDTNGKLVSQASVCVGT